MLSTNTFEYAVKDGSNFAKAEFRFWLPSNVGVVNGVVVLVPGSDGDGRDMVHDPLWQSFAQRHGWALAGCFFKNKDRPAGSPQFIELYSLASGGSGQALLDALDVFATESRHPEISSAPLLLWGISAGGQFNYEFVCWKAERVLAFVVNKGGVYFTHRAPEAACCVPGLFFIGEDDLEFRKMSLYGIYAMNRRARALWTLAVEPHVGHDVGCTSPLSEAFFEAVLPLRFPANGSTRLLDLKEDPGWTGDLYNHEFRQGSMREDEWCSWLPDEAFARQWQKFVTGSS